MVSNFREKAVRPVRTLTKNHSRLHSRPNNMPRAPAQPKRDPRLRALKPPVDPWGWIVEEPVRKRTAREIEYNIDGMDTKPSFYAMVKTALLANKMHYVRGVTLNAICKHVAAHWPVDLDTYRRLTRVAIKRAIEAGKIETVEGPGVAYRLAAAERGNRGQQSDDEDAKPKRRGPARGGVVASKRGTTGKSKRADSSDEEDSEEEAPRKVSKKTAKKNNSSRVPKGDHLQQQPGEGKWVCYQSMHTIATHTMKVFSSLPDTIQSLLSTNTVSRARKIKTCFFRPYHSQSP